MYNFHPFPFQPVVGCSARGHWCFASEMTYFPRGFQRIGWWWLRWFQSPFFSDLFMGVVIDWIFLRSKDGWWLVGDGWWWLVMVGDGWWFQSFFHCVPLDLLRSQTRVDQERKEAETQRQQTVLRLAPVVSQLWNVTSEKKQKKHRKSKGVACNIFDKWNTKSNLKPIQAYSTHRKISSRQAMDIHDLKLDSFGWYFHKLLHGAPGPAQFWVSARGDGVIYVDVRYMLIHGCFQKMGDQPNHPEIRLSSTIDRPF